MRTHQRFIATAAIVGAALLSPAPVCAERTVRAASSLVEREEFGGAAVPEDTANIIALREPAGADVNMEEFSGRRRLMWWNWIAGHLHKPACLLPHERDHKPECQETTTSSSGGSGSSGSSSSSSSGSNGNGNGNNVNSATTSDGTGGGADASSKTIMGTTPSSMLALVAAALAAGTAIAAAVIGSRRRDNSAAHPLQGSVKNRMRLFGNFADRNLVGKTERPCGRVVEMSSPPIVEDVNYNEMV